MRLLEVEWLDTADNTDLSPDEQYEVLGRSFTGNKIWLSPEANMPVRVVTHELGHTLLGHCGRPGTGDAILNILYESVLEVEADATAMLVCAALELDDEVEACRLYIWHKIQDMPIPLKPRQRIKVAAAAILLAGLIRRNDE
jgi:hypothetical protein